MRQKIIITATVIALIGVGVFVYFYFFAASAGVSVTPAGSVSFPVAGQSQQGIDVEQPGLSGATSAGGKPVLVTARLVKISAGPVVPGEVIIDIPAANASSSPEVAVSYIERQSGNVFTYRTQSGTITRTSNRTIPGIQSAVWLPDASLAFVRYLSGDDFSTINTYALPGSESGNKQGFFLPQNLADISVSSTSILSLASGVNGSIGSIRRIDGTNASEAFSTTLSSLRVSFAGKNQYVAYTKPSATLPGYAFVVSSAGNFSRISGPLDGLVALASHSGKWALVSFVSNGAMRMKIVNMATGEDVSLPVATIADKCVWTADDSSIYCGVPINPSRDYAYPDDWYQGAVSFSDRLWKIDVSDRFAQLVLDFSKETEEALDAKALAINPSGTVLVFMNKLDGSLWNYKL